MSLAEPLLKQEPLPKEEPASVFDHQDAEMEATDPADDLFGDDDADVDKHESATASPAPEAQHAHALEYQEEDEPEQEVVFIKEAELAIPKLPPPRSSDGDYWTFRIPNYCKMDSRPFHPDTYVGPEQDDDESLRTATREKSMGIKLEVQSTVRWRWTLDENGQSKRQSNSRIIRWSDGSMSLLLGKELFDIDQKIDMSANRDILGNSQAIPSGKVQGLTYLVSQHKRAQVLQSEVLITGTMSLKPTGMQSQTHRMLVRAVGQKHNKVARLRMDYELDQELSVSQAAAIKSAKKPKRTRREPGDSGDSPSKRRRRSFGASSRRRSDPVWSDEEVEFGASDEDEEDYDNIDSSPRKTVRRAAGPKETGEYQEDDFVVADSTDEEAGSDAAPKAFKKRPRPDEEEAEAEEDDLDKLDRAVEKQEAERRKNKGSPSRPKSSAETRKEDEETADEMDVESEEEDEVKVRKAGAGSGRKKRAIDFEEEED